MPENAQPESRAALHEPFTGAHVHVHTANGDQGGDATHEHEHTHDGDANHGHTHERSSGDAGEERSTPPDANDVPGEIGDGDGDADDAGTVPCPSCVTMNSPDDDTCVNCGASLVIEGADGQEAGDGLAIDSLIADGDADDMEGTPIDPAVPFGSRQRTPDVAVVRSLVGAGVALRDDPAAAPGSGSLMYGYLSTFDDPYEIDSFMEGQFIERVAPGAYDETIRADLAAMRVLYDHGYDPALGNKPLGPIRTLREDQKGAYYEVPLLDTDYNRNFVLPCLRGQLMTGELTGSLLGASMRFVVMEDTWDRSGKASKENPKGLPIRTITRAQVLEFGPVTFPANIGATAGVRSVRSGTDRFVDHLHNDPAFVARFAARFGEGQTTRLIEATRSSAAMARTAHHASKPASGSSVRSLTQRRALVDLHDVKEAV